MSVQVYKVFFSENVMYAGCIGLLGVFICIKAKKGNSYIFKCLSLVPLGSSHKDPTLDLPLNLAITQHRLSISSVTIISASRLSRTPFTQGDLNPRP